MTENLFTPDCIRTYSGKYVNVFDPDPETINIIDIAHALSQQCRFGGHLPHFYSVAQHSIQVMYNVSIEHKLSALLHDASEAYLLDIPTPIKARLANYKEVEDHLMRVIANKYDLQWPLCAEIKQADKEQLQYEWQDLMILKSTNILRMTHGQAKAKFIHNFNRLVKERKLSAV